MHTQHHTPGNEAKEQNKTIHTDTSEKATQVSEPRIDRPDGPFEHSGETSRWTEEERKEAEEDPAQ